tara:strand:- start:101 stop:946 length:846 start_codon:yes stop_codon:yes gene_type:complete
MQLKFSKYHGCGNDFICIDCRDIQLDITAVAPQISNRHFSIGADGVLGVFDSDIADYKMVIVNSDGSIPEMCGNGLRCFVHYLLDLGESIEKTLSIETGAGVLHASVIDYANNQLISSISMGRPAYLEQLPSKDFAFDYAHSLTHAIDFGMGEFEFIPISMGNPHAVFFVDNLHDINVHELGPMIESHPYFPNRVNVEFVQVVSNQRFKFRVWERGAGETNACGTGACASVVAGVLSKRSDGDVLVELLGGELRISFHLEDQQIIMEGPSAFVFSSELNLT